MTWRVEFHECGWSSRWLVVRGYYGSLTLLNEGYTSEQRAQEAAKCANEVLK